ncbi:uncharacterized protein [Nicotiana tomentosiformis]|uniref:uncharacterized protein n=1 Tax=Nicotiana tomentosiformis TaxID=4098 RepID=UPI00388C3680
MVATWGESSDDDEEDEQALMAIGESNEETEVSVIHLKDKIKLLSKERFSELLLELIDEYEDVNNEKEQLSKECVILKAKCKYLELSVSETVSENTVLKNQVHALDSTVLELRSENLKFKLGTGKKIVDHTQLSLEENIEKMKDELYKRDEKVRILKDDLSKDSTQNGVVERKNRTLDEMARTVLLSSKLPHSFWTEDVNTACYIINRCMTRPLIEKTPYELLKGRKPNIYHLRAFGCNCFVHNNGKDSLDKFDPKSDEGVFLEYSSHSKAYKIYNKRTMCVEESVHMVFDETNILSERQEHDDEAIGLDADWVNEINKLDKDGTITKNKARLVVQGYSQEDETFAPVARLETIRLLIAFAAYMEFTLH